MKENKEETEQIEIKGDSEIPYIGKGNEESEVNPQDRAWLVKRENLPEVYTLEEFERIEFKTSPIIEGLLFKSNISIIGAKPKVGKSTLMRYAAKCLVDNDSFLGRKTYPGKVLYLALEEPYQNVQRDFMAMNVENKKEIYISSLRDEPDRLMAMERLIELYKPALVIVDTMVHITKINDLNDYIQTTKALKFVRDISEKYDCHILLVHHSRKGESSGNDSAILGSTGLLGAVDLILNLETDSKKIRLISTNGRSGVHFDKVPLQFDPESMHFSELAEYAPKLEDRILEIIKSNPGITRQELQNFLKIRSEDLTNGLAVLKANGLVETTKLDRKDSYTLKQIANESDGGEE